MTLPKDLENPPRQTFAVIKITKENLGTMMACASDSPAGEERLMYALWTFPYRKGIVYYFVGGNFRNANYPDYYTHILTEDELNLLFACQRPKARQGHNPDINWFAAKLKDLEDEAVIA